ncbi:TrmH family RNA methyltransferase [uncultured Flavobacterium sp.]|uniref:TrmH family RNA methyltransferase n=1 Tax=uncultured Flavobacterium sp. TaxID=165435 RepID=UPI003458F516
MSLQLNHEQKRFSEKKFPITLICDRIYFQDNIGSIFRISEAFGVEKIVFIGENLPLNPRKINRTSRSTHLTIPYEVINNEAEIIDYLSDYEIISLEITSSSQAIQDLKIPNKKIALIIGNEISGISEKLLKISNQTVHIEMFGKNSSMNVVQATGIALFEITKKLSI